MILTYHVNAKAVELAQSCLDAPILYSYQSDATSYLTRTSNRGRVDGTLVVRDGRTLSEFLMERGYLFMERPSGAQSSAVLVRIPRALTEGKRGLAKLHFVL